MQDTCSSVGVSLALPEQLTACSTGSVPPADSRRGLTAHTAQGEAESKAAASVSSVKISRAQMSSSRTSSTGSSSGTMAPALLPPPSRVSLAKQRAPDWASLRACINPEVCLLLHIPASSICSPCCLEHAFEPKHQRIKHMHVPRKVAVIPVLVHGTHTPTQI